MLSCETRFQYGRALGNGACGLVFRVQPCTFQALLLMPGLTANSSSRTSRL